MLLRGSPEAILLPCASPAIPQLAGIWAFWQRETFWLPFRSAHRCSTSNTLFPSAFHAGYRIIVMLWLCTSAALLILREMFAVTYRLLLLLTVLLVLLCSRSLETCERWCH